MASSKWCLVVVSLVACGKVLDNGVPDAVPVSDAAVDAVPPIDGQPFAERSLVAAHHVLDQVKAGQALSGSFTTASSRLLFIVAGSGQRPGGDYAVGMSVLLDDKIVGGALTSSNEPDSSKAFVRSVFAVDAVAPGKHEVSVLARTGTTMGTDDLVDVMVLELGERARVVPIFTLEKGQPGGAKLFSADLETRGGTGVLFLAGSGYGGVGKLGMSALIDDREVARSTGYTNEASSHKAFVPGEPVLQPDPGTHRFAIKPFEGTLINQDDFVSALWLELGDDVVATTLIDQKNATQSLSSRLNTGGGRVVVVASGSGWHSSTPGTIGQTVQFDGKPLVRSRVMTSEPTSHKTLVATAALIELAAGEHGVMALQNADTTVDGNDYFSATAIELAR